MSRATSNAAAAAQLSPQEERILELIGEGLTNRQIGERLHLAEQTVKNYLSDAMRRLGVDDRARTLVLLEDGVEVLRMPIDLHPRTLNRIVP